ncbi:hypothetical protein QUB42_19705, partial [Microcoleus sp. Aus8_D1]
MLNINRKIGAIFTADLDRELRAVARNPVSRKNLALSRINIGRNRVSDVSVSPEDIDRELRAVARNPVSRKNLALSRINIG